MKEAIASLASFPFVLALSVYRAPRSVLRGNKTKLSWSLRKPMLHEREDAVGAVVDGKLYAVAGFEPGPNGPVISGRLERYDPKTDSWEELPLLPSPRHHCEAAGFNGKLYVFGGHGDLKNSVTYNETYEFNPKTNRWRRKADMPNHRAAGGIAVLDKKIYLIGGRKGGSVFEGNFKPPLTAVDVYDPAKDRWEKAAPMGVPRDHLGVAVLNGKIYAIGGRAFTLLNTLNAVEVYDPEKDKWSFAEPLPLPLSGDVFASDGRIVMPGGVLGILKPAVSLVYEPGKGWKFAGLVGGGGYAHGVAELNGIGYVLSESPNGGYVYSRLNRTITIKEDER